MTDGGKATRVLQRVLGRRWRVSSVEQVAIPSAPIRSADRTPLPRHCNVRTHPSGRTFERKSERLDLDMLHDRYAMSALQDLCKTSSSEVDLCRAKLCNGQLCNTIYFNHLRPTGELRTRGSWVQILPGAPVFRHFRVGFRRPFVLLQDISPDRLGRSPLPPYAAPRSLNAPCRSTPQPGPRGS